uniref:hypothetical protein n=1 Tax=Conidiobolus taihushanensis TaxID=2721185 RepID=UPI001D108287|nr:hypothetical protein LK112_mgp17 [Conidiobolus taihushanensis]QZZ81394.1 hypothetical protein [Conidiobolus taihushanensis]
MILFNLKLFSKENDTIILKITSAHVNITSLDNLFQLNVSLFNYYTESLTQTGYIYSESVKDMIRFNKKNTTLIYISDIESTNELVESYRDISGYNFHIYTPINTVEIIRNSILYELDKSTENKDINFTVTNNCYFILSPNYPLYDFVQVCKNNDIIITGGPKAFEFDTQHSRLSNLIKNVGLKDSHLSDNHPNNNLIRKITKKKKIYTLNSNKSYSTMASSEKLMLFTHNDYFQKLNKILLSNNTLEEKQLELEKTINNYYHDIHIKDLSDYSNINRTFLNKYALDFFKNLKGFLDINPTHILSKLPVNVIIGLTIKVFLRYVAKSSNKINRTNLIMDIGNVIIERIYLLDDGIKSSYTYEEYLSKNTFNITDIGNILIELLNHKEHLFTPKTFIEDNKRVLYLILKGDLDSLLHFIPIRLPMIVPPKEWTDEGYGGYLLNGKEYIENIKITSFDNKGSTIVNSTVKNSINMLSRVGFKINLDMLNYLIENPPQPNTIHPDTKHFNDLNNKIQKEILIHNSKYINNKIIINFAKFLSQVEVFYFPYKIDWRGRLYTTSTYLSPQGNELAKSLLKFAKPSITKVLKILKFMGLLYMSIEHRIKWIDNNHDNILALDDSFISKAKNIYLFRAFSYEYKAIINNIISSESSLLPIQLDCTCSGLQHLACIINEFNIAKLTNLLQSDASQSPEDIYTKCCELVKNDIAIIIAQKSKHYRLVNLNLNRKLIKKIIMTIPYNVTKYTIRAYLVEHFTPKLNTDSNIKSKYIYLLNEYGENFITDMDLTKLCDCLYNILYKYSPQLKNLVDYFSKITIMMNELNIPIIWNTPSGLKITQKYVKMETKRVSSTVYKKTNTISISIPTNVINKNKQKIALMPNYVHSMDANS